MASLFWIQLKALIWKNWIVLSKHPWFNLLRCFIFPIGYGAFWSVAQTFFDKPNNYGIGQPVSIFSLQEEFIGTKKLIWADGTNGTSSPSPSDIMGRITSSFTPAQKALVKKVDHPADILDACPQNFGWFSDCFAAVAFNDIPANTSMGRPINYTIRADAALKYIDVVNHKSDFEKRILPLQWAIDQAIIEMKTGTSPPTPQQWPFTIWTNEEQPVSVRINYVHGIRKIIVIAHFACFVGIAYHLPGAIAGERANGITAHMKAMGLLDSARIVSWYFSISVLYLPAWIAVGLIWHYRIYSATNAGVIVVIHLLLGLVLGSWSFFVAAPFGKSPQLAAVISTLLGIVSAVLALVLKNVGTGTAMILSLLFPPSFYVFAMRAVAGYEIHKLPTNILEGDPDHDLVLLAIVMVALIDTLLWPWLAVLWERKMYDAPDPMKRGWQFWKKSKPDTITIPKDTAISIRNLRKTFQTSFFKSDDVVAIDDLSFDVPKTGIFVLLGSNGAGKSTCLSILGGLVGKTSGAIVFSGGLTRPPRGSMGIVPQKNVLFPELTCVQNLRVWKSVKWSLKSNPNEDIEQLLRDCDLEHKVDANADTLSGGQKRKLQLAIGLVGGSEIVLVDECTSGVDPLSRRALWRILTSFREERSIIFTTHSLDEADLLADHIAILASPGKLVAEGSPVLLKRAFGKGYSIRVLFAPLDAEKSSYETRNSLLYRIRATCPDTYTTLPSPNVITYHLATKEVGDIKNVLKTLEEEKAIYSITSYDVLGTTIEDVFLDLMAKELDQGLGGMGRDSGGNLSSGEKFETLPMQLTNGQAVSPLRHALTIFYKRRLIVRRSWLTPLLAIIVAVAGSTIPLVFLLGRRQTNLLKSDILPLSFLSSPLSLTSFSDSSRARVSPPGIANLLENPTSVFRITDIKDNATFVETIEQGYRHLSLGGVSIDMNNGASLVAWEATPPGIAGPLMLNLATNLLLNRALRSSGNTIPTIIQAECEPLRLDRGRTFASLRWISFFCAAMSVYPAFFALYVCQERRSSVQAMQMSNGLGNPLGLWLGHLLFDLIIVVIASTLIIIIFATAAPDSALSGLGFFWLVLVLYGVTGALFAYCLSLMAPSPMAAFALASGYQIVMFSLYLSGYVMTLTFGKASTSLRTTAVIHFILALASPVASITRAALVSVDLFSLLYHGHDVAAPAPLGDIMRFGGPIVYLIIHSVVLLSTLVWVDSGSQLPKRIKKTLGRSGFKITRENPSDVVETAHAASNSLNMLRVLNVSRTYGKNKVVDDVTLGVSRNTLFALLGPNGAGKTTTFNMIRGDVVPDSGDVLIGGTSVVHHPQLARLSLGVCPQFTAIDSQLTVREHLLVYGRLKGLENGQVLIDNVDSILRGTSLTSYADRLASKLSGGNQRKLALAIALMGNPPVILIDEFSTGVDAKMKREMWLTLRNVAVGKAIIITTHSMEEASALANKVGILAKRLLAVGSTEELSARYPTYEVHFACRTREEKQAAQALMAKIPGSRMVDDVATRFEVPIHDSKMSLLQLFTILSGSQSFGQYTVEKSSLESIFLKIIKADKVVEEDQLRSRKRWWCC